MILFVIVIIFLLALYLTAHRRPIAVEQQADPNPTEQVDSDAPSQPDATAPQDQQAEPQSDDPADDEQSAAPQGNGDGEEEMPADDPNAQ